MSSSGRPTGAVNVVRRTWDKEEFEKRAKERAEREAAGVRSDDEDEGRGRGGRVDGGAGGAGAGAGAGDAFRQAAAGAAGPEGSKRAFLSARTEELSLEANLNKRKVSSSVC